MKHAKDPGNGGIRTLTVRQLQAQRPWVLTIYSIAEHHVYSMNHLYVKLQ